LDEHNEEEVRERKSGLGSVDDRIILIFHLQNEFINQKEIRELPFELRNP